MPEFIMSASITSSSSGLLAPGQCTQSYALQHLGRWVGQGHWSYSPQLPGMISWCWRSCGIWQIGIIVELSCHTPEHWIQLGCSLFPWLTSTQRVQCACQWPGHFPPTLAGGAYLWVFFKYLTLWYLTRDMNASHFSRTKKSHQFKQNPRTTPIWITNSATWTGWDSLRLDSFSQEVEPSFHLQQVNKPFVYSPWQVFPWLWSAAGQR